MAAQPAGKIVRNVAAPRGRLVRAAPPRARTSPPRSPVLSPAPPLDHAQATTSFRGLKRTCAVFLLAGICAGFLISPSSFESATASVVPEESTPALPSIHGIGDAYEREQNGHRMNNPTGLPLRAVVSMVDVAKVVAPPSSMKPRQDVIRASHPQSHAEPASHAGATSHTAMVAKVHSIIKKHSPKHRSALTLAESIVREAKAERYDPLFVAAVIKSESTFNTMARSHKGAQGLMQLMPKTGAWMADKSDLKRGSLTDPGYNLKLGIKYLKHLEETYSGDRVFTLIAYNWGPGRVDSATDGKRRVPPEVVTYAVKIMNDYRRWLREAGL